MELEWFLSQRDTDISCSDCGQFCPPVFDLQTPLNSCFPLDDIIQLHLPYVTLKSGVPPRYMMGSQFNL